MDQRNNIQQDADKLSSFFNSIRIRVLAFLCVGVVAALNVSPVHAGVAEDAIFEGSIGAGFAIPSGGFSNYYDTLGANTGLELDFSGGYFVTPNLSLGVAFEYAQFSVDNPNNPQHYRFYTFGVYGKYFTGLDSKVSPYLRVQGGLTIPNFSAPLTMSPPDTFAETQFEVGFDGLIGVGARISTSSKSGIYLEADYHFKQISGATGNFGDEILTLPGDAAYIQLNMGIGFDFGPKQ